MKKRKLNAKIILNLILPIILREDRAVVLDIQYQIEAMIVIIEIMSKTWKVDDGLKIHFLKIKNYILLHQGFDALKMMTSIKQYQDCSSWPI